uniref:Uncharacterized protein n=1 Tax=Rhizophora mucronata TaxID=61149 RepID=A0A2P2K3R0_RHIMU
MDTSLVVQSRGLLPLLQFRWSSAVLYRVVPRTKENKLAGLKVLRALYLSPLINCLL